MLLISTNWPSNLMLVQASSWRKMLISPQCSCLSSRTMFPTYPITRYLHNPTPPPHDSSHPNSQSPTKLPYPPNFYYPASSLQHQMSLQMQHVDTLVNANSLPTPLDRFIAVLKYTLSTCSLTKVCHSLSLSPQSHLLFLHTRP